MAVSAPLPATYATLLNLTGEVRGEILAGHLVTAPAPLPRHSAVQRSASRFIGGPFHDDDGHGGPGGWWIFTEVDIELSAHDIVRPDLAGWRRERLVRPGTQRPMTIVPDWVCEILSPSTAARDRVQKRRLYAQAKIPFYWIIDPDTRIVEALQLYAETWIEVGTYDESSVAQIAPFDAIELQVGRLFLPREADENP